MHVLSAGFFSTFQDQGRKGYRKYGVPYSGVMDSYCAGLANLLVNNAAEVPVIEITLQGPTLQFDGDAVISIVGADMSPVINNKPIKLNSAITLRSGDQLSFGKLMHGCRSYLAVSDGFAITKVLGSYSYYTGIADDNLLRKERVLQINQPRKISVPNTKVKIDPNHFTSPYIEVIKGPEFSWLSMDQQNALLETDFIVSSKNNRMGYQLEGAPLLCKNDFSMITDVTIPGTVQLPPDGNPIVLMRDCQTTGGYPRILQLTENGINRLSQKKTNDIIRFQLGNVPDQCVNTKQ